MADGSAVIAEALDHNLHAKRGRPTMRTPEIEEAILDGLRQGIPLGRLCKTRKDLPDRHTVSHWRDIDESFHAKVTLARARGCDALAEDSLEIADNTERDVLTDAEGNESANHGAIARDRLRIDTRLKLAAVWNHAEYGAKQTVEGEVKLTLESIVLTYLDKKEPLNITPDANTSLPTANSYEDLV